MKSVMNSAVFLVALIAAPLAANAQEVAADKQQAIMEMLKTMQCEVDPENIEMSGEGYELDDVFCADGQYDMELGADLAVVEKRKE